jgi:hypothetical protein
MQLLSKHLYLMIHITERHIPFIPCHSVPVLTTDDRSSHDENVKQSHQLNSEILLTS